MKKGLLVSIGVIALLALMVWADRKFPAADKPAMTTINAPGDTPLLNIPLKGLDDRDITLAQYKGQVVLVNFWATWCKPCQTEIPWMIEFQKKYNGRGFTILGVSVYEDGKKAVPPFLERERFDVGGQKEAIDYPILIGTDTTPEQFGGLIGLPTSMLFTRDGKRIRTIVGLVNHDDISKAIESLL